MTQPSLKSLNGPTHLGAPDDRGGTDSLPIDGDAIIRSGIEASWVCLIGLFCGIAGLLSGVFLPRLVREQRDRAQLNALEAQVSAYWDGWQEDSRSLRTRLAVEETARRVAEVVAAKMATEAEGVRKDNELLRSTNAKLTYDLDSVRDSLRAELDRPRGAANRPAPTPRMERENPQDQEPPGKAEMPGWFGLVDGGLIGVMTEPPRIVRGDLDKMLGQILGKLPELKQYRFIVAMVDNQKGRSSIDYVEGHGFITVVTDEGTQYTSLAFTLGLSMKYGEPFRDFARGTWDSTTVVPGSNVLRLVAFPSELDPKRIKRVFWGLFQPKELKRVE